ncbi:hypothetical protein [Microscilla marina]|uniref:Uncharacterized protein n=1 Tax=Microscilla marina ATCC 23134 TaxID=313606 RepID=A1ZV89_MICM2|nr:hypothetical protein [Microscilla marina]EAY25745.1 hypothetical protein M23134_04919 [Microscilla marina ATCC 23134]
MKHIDFTLRHFLALCSILSLLLLAPTLGYAIPKIKKIDIYVINKLNKFSVAPTEDKLTRPGLHTQYTLVNEKHFGPFQKIIEQVPDSIKAKKRFLYGITKLVAQVFYTDGTSVSLGTYITLRYNGHYTNIASQEFINALKPFISPTLNWHSEKLNQEYLHYGSRFDGFIVRFSEKAKQFINTKKLRQQYFSPQEYKQAFEPFNDEMLLGIDWRKRKVVSISFSSQDEPHIQQGEMPLALYKKYKKIILEQLTVKEVLNLYHIQSDIIYKAVFYK